MLCQEGNSCPPLMGGEWAYSLREQERGAGGREACGEGALNVLPRGAPCHTASVSWEGERPACKEVNQVPKVTLQAVAQTGQSADPSCPRPLTRNHFPSKSIDTCNQSEGRQPLLPCRPCSANRAAHTGFLHPCEAPLLPLLERCTGLGGFLACIVPAGLSTFHNSQLAPCYQVHTDKMLQFKTRHESAINAWSAAGFLPLYRI